MMGRYEPSHEKNGFFHVRKQRLRSASRLSFAVTAKLISAFVFATWIVHSLIFLNPKFQASSHLLWLYSPVCFGPGQKPRRPVFSQRGSYDDGVQYAPDICNCMTGRGSSVGREAAWDASGPEIDPCVRHIIS